MSPRPGPPAGGPSPAGAAAPATLGADPPALGPALPFERHVRLESGLLTLAWKQEDRLDLDQLTTFATRRNPRRGFLFVSKVLGRHWPVPVRTMAAVHARLADRIPADLPGPVAMIAMAETAVALGTGVFAQWQHRTGRGDAVFLHSTRYRLDRPLLLEFEEGHSHASRHLLYQPADPDLAQRLGQARTVVLIDDEISSGATLANLARALQPLLPALRRLVTVCLTDWSLTAAGDHTRLMPWATLPVRLILGRHSFTPRPGLEAEAMPDVTGSDQLKDPLLPRNDGRLGLSRVGRLDPALIQAADPRGRDPGAAAARILVLGCGEFTFAPFQLAQALAERGHEVWVQAITRSPIRRGDAIRHIWETTDAVGDGIPHWLYNVDTADYDHILVGHETPAFAWAAQQPLLAGLGAQPVSFIGAGAPA